MGQYQSSESLEHHTNDKLHNLVDNRVNDQVDHQSNDQSDSYFIYKDSANVGYLESLMNSLIFVPPNPPRERFNGLTNADRSNGKASDIHPSQAEKRPIPEWVKFITLPNTNKLSYFVIDPNPVYDSTGKQVQNRYILWSHGNAGDLTSIYPVMMQIFREMQGRVGIIAYDYEGYRYSEGVCSEKNCYNDLVCMVKHAVENMKIRKENLFLVGQSLGTGVVVDFCVRHGWRTPIILLSPYKSISRVVLDPHWTDPLTNILVDSIDMFTTHHKTDRLSCPVIIYHGVKDRLIHPRHSVELYNRHRDKITLVLLKHADHNDILNHVRPSQILDMIDRVTIKTI
ncbi:hydrolase family protein [Yasminevirus sp. GU-2018]|uniref:Hydrolase family protein n=1 Tax=Yasminevirus sp. GU-2018 TaxID=2420051 RepID=A0A5K0UB30_9VIRU|nr:hydrolase family protein [Yasminevirus sp. GU-2018]